MKISVLRISFLMFTAGLAFAGCRSLPRSEPAPLPVPVSKKTAPPEKKAAAAAPAPGQELFMIQRSKNANIVRYDANLGKDGNLVPGQPVLAYWVLLAEDGRVKKLNWLEKKKAYGVRTRPDPAGNGYVITLAAAAWLPITIKQDGAAVRAEAAINGQPAVLNKMFIQAIDKLLGPKVEYIELFGKDLKTGGARREKIFPR